MEMEQSEKKFAVVGIGEVLWDIYRDRRHLGGAPANFAIHAAQAGDQGILVSRVGNDGMGRELIAALRQRQLPVEFLQSDAKKGTGTVMVTLDVKGVPSFRCSHDVAFDYLQNPPELENLAPRAAAVLFGTLAQRSPIARQTILAFLRAAKNAVRLFDVNSRASVAELQAIVPESLELANALKMNHGEMKLLQTILRREQDSPRKFIEYLIKKYALKIVAVTYGENGCEIFDAVGAVKIGGLPVRVVDTTGAGDAFAAGLMHQLLRGAPLREIAEYANLLGAFLCTQSGATPVFNQQDIEAFRESL
jgi:fructokinase